MIAQEGTEILVLENDIWYNIDSQGKKIRIDTPSYLKRYIFKNSLVVIDNKEQCDKINSLNNGELTVIVDKNKVGLPYLQSFEFTKEWISIDTFLKLRKGTDKFCLHATNFYIPNK